MIATCRACQSKREHATPGKPHFLCPTCRQTLRWCRRCEATKPLTEFTRAVYCTPCTAVYNAANTDARKSQRLLRLYGVTLAERHAMAERQQGRCAICQEERPLCVDHCHATGLARELICRECNSALGMLRDSAALAMAAAEYLLKHRAQPRVPASDPVRN